MADAPNPMPPTPDLPGVTQNTGDAQAQALGAMAKYGQAGLDAYTQAQNAVQASRQNILGQLAQTQGIGGDAQSLLSSQVQASMAPHLADLQQGQANLQGDLALGQQQYSKYAAEANAAVPVLQGNLQTQMGIRDQALQLAQQQVDAQKAAQAAQNAHDLQMQALQLQTAQANASKAASGASAATAKSAALPKFNDLVGAATALQPVDENTTAAQVSGEFPLTNEMLMQAQDEAGYATSGDTRYSTDPTINLAKIYGQASGLAPAQVNAIVTPQAVKTYENAQPQPVTPDDLKAATAALKGDTGGAQAVLSGSRWPAVQQAVNAIATAPRDASGKINDGSKYSSMTPWAAFSQWVTSPDAQLAPGDTKTPAVATAFYKSFLDSLK